MSADNPQSIDLLLRRFRQLYGEGGANVLRAPARINILGEHVDYVSYLPTASLAFGSHEHAMTMVFRPTGDGKIRGASTSEGFESFEFSISEVKPPTQGEQSWENFVFSCPAPVPHWSNYVKGAVSFAEWKFGASVKHGFEFLIDSTIPSASGASSSSALVVLAGAAIRLANAIEYENSELAIDSSQAEWFLGTRGGALDHKTICDASRWGLVVIEHSEKQSHSGYEPVRAKNFRWVTFFTQPADKGREVMLEYNERAAVSRLIIPALLSDWKQESPRRALKWLQVVAKLPSYEIDVWDQAAMLLNYLPETITLKELSSRLPETYQKCETAFPALVAERRSSPLKVRDRALHHLGENWRVWEAKSWFAAITRDEYIEEAMRNIGHLITQSHSSLRDLYEVSTPEVESLIEVIRTDDQVYGARLMGGGFGGNVLALTMMDNVSALVDRVQREYYTPRNRDCLAEASVMISTPGEGLAVLNLDS